MSKPFPQFNVLRTSAKRQKVSLHIQRSVLLLKEILGSVFVVGYDVGRQVRCNGRRVVKTLCTRHSPLRLCPLLALASVHFGLVVGVLVVPPAAKALTTVEHQMVSSEVTDKSGRIYQVERQARYQNIKCRRGVKGLGVQNSRC